MACFRNCSQSLHSVAALLGDARLGVVVLQLDFAQVAVLCGIQHRAAKGAAPQRRQLHGAVCGNQQKLYVTEFGGVYQHRLRRATREAVSQRGGAVTSVMAFLQEMVCNRALLPSRRHSYCRELDAADTAARKYKHRSPWSVPGK